MLTVRNSLAAALFLFGASFLWLTPMWIGQANPKLGVFEPKGLPAILTVVGFALAAWGCSRPLAGGSRSRSAPPSSESLQ